MTDQQLLPAEDGTELLRGEHAAERPHLPTRPQPTAEELNPQLLLLGLSGTVRVAMALGREAPQQQYPQPPAGSVAVKKAAARSELRRGPPVQKGGVNAVAVATPSQRIGGGGVRLHSQLPLLRARIRRAVLLATVGWLAAALQGLFSAGLYRTKDPTATSVVVSTAANDRPDQLLPREIRGLRPRAFLRWGSRGGHNQSLPCFPPNPDWRTIQRGPTRYGFVFVKPIKEGPSTGSGVNLRIARGTALRLHQREIDMVLRSGRTEHDFPVRYTICKARSDHVPAARLTYGALNRKRSFLWTVLTDPTHRAVSLFFGKVEPSDANFAELLSHPSQRHYYLRMLSLQKVPEEGYTNAINATEFVYRRFAQNILDSYDFVGVTERMDESLVALSMLLHVPLSDVLYLQARGHGEWDDGTDWNSRTCNTIGPSLVSEEMRTSLASPRWRRDSRWDQALHVAANISLDYTIDRTLGRNAFEAQLALYQSVLKFAQDRCATNDTFPCTPGVQDSDVLPNQTDCLWNDSGCGTSCLDAVANDLGL